MTENPDPQVLSYTSIERALAAVRLAAYRTHNDTAAQVIARYRWNSALCAALLPVLGHLEVAFRNSLSSAIAGLVRRPDWYDVTPTRLRTRECEAIAKSKAELMRQGKPETPDRIIAELRLGFWTSLLSRDYERIFWPSLLPVVFCRVPRHLRTRSHVMRRLDCIRRLRNRVAHQEPIWHWHDLRQQHDDLCATIHWFEPSLLQLVDQTHRFDRVYDAGPTAYWMAVSE